MSAKMKEAWDWFDKQPEEVQIELLYPKWKRGNLTALEYAKKIEKEEREEDLAFAKERVEDLTLEIVKVEEKLSDLNTRLKRHIRFINENKPQGELFVTS